jgi:hypothetical protein
MEEDWKQKTKKKVEILKQTKDSKGKKERRRNRRKSMGG